MNDSTITEDYARNVGELHPDDLKFGVPILPGLMFGNCEDCQEWRPKEDPWWLCRVPEEEGPITGWDLYGCNLTHLCVNCSMKRGLEGFIWGDFYEYLTEKMPCEYIDGTFVYEPLPTQVGDMTEDEARDILFEEFLAGLGASTKERLEEAYFKDFFYRREHIAYGVCFAEIKDFMEE